MHTPFTPSSRSLWRPLLALLLLALFLGLTPNFTPASGEPLASDGLTLDTFLNPDGTLNLPPEGVLGSIDPTGYQLVSAEGRLPRFSMAEEETPDFGTDNANWDPRFNTSEINSEVIAPSWERMNLGIGAYDNGVRDVLFLSKEI